MTQPTGINYPTTYEDDLSLLGEIQNRETFTLYETINLSTLFIKINEDLSGLNLPAYLVFAGGEIIFVDVGEVNTSTTPDQLELTSIDQRGVQGSESQTHSTNEKIYNTFIEIHQEQLRDAIIAAQEFGFLMGTYANRPVTGQLAGEAYYATDTNKVYFCFTAGDDTWTQIKPWGNHSELTGLTSGDDHGDFHTDARAVTWHSGLGKSHQVSGNDHDHITTNEGNAIKVIEGGASLPSSPSYIGQIYFDVTADNNIGVLYISYDGATWSTLSGVPSGGIAIFSSACPSGWSAYSASGDLAGKYAMADASVITGGANTHSHGYSQHKTHTHSIGATGGNVGSAGAHTHTFSTGGGATGGNLSGGNSNSTSGTGSGGSHSHGWDLSGGSSTSTGSSSGTTTTENNEPEYREMIFCKKD